MQDVLLDVAAIRNIAVEKESAINKVLEAKERRIKYLNRFVQITLAFTVITFVSTLESKGWIKFTSIWLLIAYIALLIIRTKLKMSSQLDLQYWLKSRFYVIVVHCDQLDSAYKLNPFKIKDDWLEDLLLLRSELEQAISDHLNCSAGLTASYDQYEEIKSENKRRLASIKHKMPELKQASEYL